MIGVFDSGSGGLTVLAALAQRLPEQRFLYLGDHANAPYGPRPAEEILALTRAGVEALFARGCRLVVLACNTASAIALRPLQQQWLPQRWPERRLLGVFVPLVEALTGRVWDRDDDRPDPRPCFDLAVFATPATVASGAFGLEIGRRLPGVRVWEQACPGLVELIEAAAPAAALEAAVAGFVAALPAGERPPQRVVLGCTHYPLIEEAFRRALPAEAILFDQPQIVAGSLAGYLRRRPEILGEPDGRPGGVTLLTSGRLLPGPAGLLRRAGPGLPREPGGSLAWRTLQATDLSVHRHCDQAPS